MADRIRYSDEELAEFKELILKNVNITGCEGEPVVTGNVDKIIK